MKYKNFKGKNCVFVTRGFGTFSSIAKEIFNKEQICYSIFNGTYGTFILSTAWINNYREHVIINGKLAKILYNPEIR